MRYVILFLLFLSLFSHTVAQQINAIKIGESTNSYTNYHGRSPTVVCLPEVGSDGVVVTINQSNTKVCGTLNDERYKTRIAVSTDAGHTWDVGADTVPPPFTGCYGRGPVNNQFPTSFARLHPSVGLFSRGNNTSIDSLGLIFASPSGGSSWYGFGYSLVLNPASPMFEVKEDGFYAGDRFESLEISYELVPQHIPLGETVFWRTASTDAFSQDFQIVKGRYNPNQKELTWKTHQRIDLAKWRYSKDSPGSFRMTAFDPSGQMGWIAGLSDLIGGQDTTANPFFLFSNDYGETWGDPIEINLGDFVGLKNNIRKNTAGPQGTGKASCAYQVALTVDGQGNPHFLVSIGAASTVQDNKADYSIHEDSYLALYDVTRNPCDESWQLIHIDNLQALDGAFGDTTLGFYSILLGNTLQISRSNDGEKIFYSWADSDTSTRTMPRNGTPDLKGRALDIATGMMTPVFNWTENDSLWHGNVLSPKTAALCLQKQDTFTVPTVVMKLDSNRAHEPVSYWYFPSITYTQSQFTDPVVYTTRCADISIALHEQLTLPACGQNDGSIRLNPSGGLAPYTFQWGSHANFSDSSAVVNLTAQVYEVSITDSFGCEAHFDLSLNNINGPSVSIDSFSVQTPTCYRDSNGSIQVLAIGNNLNYLWSNGETQAKAVSLAAGRQTIRVSDTSGCVSYGVYFLEDPDSLVAEYETERVRCAFDRSGSALAVVEGGTGSRYAYHWSNGWTGEKTAGLNVGTYTCLITDESGCQRKDTVQIPGPTKPLHVEKILTTWPIPCDAFNGTISVKSAGGSPPYAYQWAHGSTSVFQFGMNQGLYQFIVKDSVGCEVTDFAFLESHESYFAIIRAEVTDSTCESDADNQIKLYIDKGYGPFTYTWTHGDTGAVVTNLTPGAYHCNISQADGCDLEAHIFVQPEKKPTLNFAYAKPFKGPDGPVGSLQAVGINNKRPYDFTYQWASGDSLDIRSCLGAGKYIATATDDRSCSVADSFELKPAFQFLEIEADITNDCNGMGLGAISLKIPNPNTRYQIQWAHGPTSSTISGLTPGNYAVSIRDTVAQCAKEYTYQVRNAPPLQLSAVIDSISCKGGSNGRIDLQVAGGSGFHHTRWRNGDSTDHLYNLALGAYQAVILDQNGCYQDSISVNMEEVRDRLQVIATTTGDRPQHGYRAVLFAEGNGGNPPYTYLWNTSPPQAKDTVTRQQRGWYQVLITDYEGCTAIDSVYVPTFNGIEEALPFKLVCYPNPNTGIFWLEIESDYPQVMELQILDIQGKVLLKEALGHHISLRHQIQLKGVTVGMYFLQVKVGDTIWREKVMVGE